MKFVILDLVRERSDRRVSGIHASTVKTRCRDGKKKQVGVHRKPYANWLFGTSKDIFRSFVHTRKTFPILPQPEAEDGMAHWETDWSRDVLERIVALLFSLAGLADLAAGLPTLRRRRLLGILGVGEAEARAFLVGASPGAPVSAEALETAADATRLAARLRALALLLCALLAQAALPGPAGMRPRRRLHDASGPAVRLPDTPAPPALDTS